MKIKKLFAISIAILVLFFSFLDITNAKGFSEDVLKLCRENYCTNQKGNGAFFNIEGENAYLYLQKKYYHFGSHNIDYKNTVRNFGTGKKFIIFKDEGDKKTECTNSRDGLCDIRLVPIGKEYEGEFYKKINLGSSEKFKKVKRKSYQTLADILRKELFFDELGDGEKFSEGLQRIYGLSSFFKEKYGESYEEKIYEYIMKNYKYDYNNEGLYKEGGYSHDEIKNIKGRGTFSGITGFMNGDTFVCQGYSHLFALMLLLNGEENVHVIIGFSKLGDVNERKLHSWNLVKGRYYDVTSDSVGYNTMYFNKQNYKKQFFRMSKKLNDSIFNIVDAL